jgi:mono/diheme cytochrome c family protein
MVLMGSRLAWSCTMLLGCVLMGMGCDSTDNTAQNSVKKAPPSDGQIQRAYTMKCSLCHGTDGRLMASKAPDLSLSKMSLEERVALITYGKGTMPPQKGILDDATIRGIAKYIEQFRD